MMARKENMSAPRSSHIVDFIFMSLLARYILGTFKVGTYITNGTVVNDPRLIGEDVFPPATQLALGCVVETLSANKSQSGSSVITGSCNSCPSANHF